MDVISVSDRRGLHYADVVSFQRESLELHLIAINMVLVRTFDLTLCRPSPPSEDDYSDPIDRIVRLESDLCYHEMINEDRFGIIRGVQVIAPSLTPGEIGQLVSNGHIADTASSAPVKFIVDDRRNNRVITVSTDPATTTNYIVGRQNALPYEMSAASFRPEVLSKYKADSEKYSVREGNIVCRGGWSLRSYWANDAGQVCAYIRDLRDLPHEEQVYWSPYNEEPKAGIPERVIKTDFRAEWLNEDDLSAINVLIRLLRRWRRDGVKWWKWVAEGSPELLTVPRTGSLNEWLDACLSLSKGVVEGFDLSAIRMCLREVGGDYKDQERSVLLLERVLRKLELIGAKERVAALWDINELRVPRAHATGGKGRQLSDAALHAHGSYAAHFENLCARLIDELKLIEKAFG